MATQYAGGTDSRLNQLLTVCGDTPNAFARAVFPPANDAAFSKCLITICPYRFYSISTKYKRGVYFSLCVLVIFLPI